MQGHYRWFLFLLLTLVLIGGAQAQFGKNKVQYRSFDWYYIQSEHLDVYFYGGGRYLAEFAAHEGEIALQSIENTLNYEIIARIPIVVYNSHNEFQQTNVVSEYMGEGIGGVTEMFKNRVVLPFEGSFELFRHVIHHELSHAVINQMFYGGSIQSMISNSVQIQLPIWMNEGFAEYESLGGWDTHSDQFLRDATVNTYLPELMDLNGYWAYRGGQSLWYYIAQRYGKEKVGEVMNRVRTSMNVNEGFRSAVGESLEDLSKEWQRAQRKLYWPDVATREASSDFATKLTDHKKDRCFYNTSPAISPNGDKIAYISDRGDYFDVYVQSLVTGDVTKVVKGNRTKNFEELHLLTPGLAWSADNRRIALAAKAGDQDAIFLIDVDHGDEEKLDLSLDGIATVAWSPTANAFAFAGNKNGQSDIYLFDVTTRTLTNVTNDVFSDSDPSFSSDGSAVFFVSDRDSFTVAGRYTQDNFKMWRHPFASQSIYKLDLATKAITRITNHPLAKDEMPLPCSDGKTLLYISDRNGINNIYKRDLQSGSDVAITNSISGIDQISISRDNQKLVFASINNNGFDIFLLRNPFERQVKGLPLALTNYMAEQRGGRVDTAKAASTPADSLAGYGSYAIDASGISAPPNQDLVVSQPRVPSTAPPVGNVDESGSYLARKYKLSFTPDLIYGTATYNTFYGAMGATEMLFSDMLGDNQIFIGLNLFQDLRNSTFSFEYLYLPNRIDWGIQGYHSAVLISPDGYSLLRYRRWGGMIEGQYPIDKFNRLDWGLHWMNLSRENVDYPDVPDSTTTHMLLMPSVSFTHDDVQWGPTAPFDGNRYYATLMASPRIGSGGLSFYSAEFDYRRYYKFLHDYSFAMRFAAGGNWGPDAPDYAMGGVANWITTLPIFLIRNEVDFAFLNLAIPMRGFDYGAQMGTKFAMANFEMRSPLIRLFVPGVLPLALQNIYGTLFWDIGSAWSSNADYRGTERLADGTVRARDLLMGTGFGARMYFLFFLLKLDVAWAYNIQGFSVPHYYVSVGEDF